VPAAFQAQDPAIRRGTRKRAFIGRGPSKRGGPSLWRGRDPSLLKGSVQDGPEVIQWERTRQGSAIDEKQRSSPDTCLLTEANVRPHMAVPPAALDAAVEAFHVQPLLPSEDREESIGVIAVSPATLVREKTCLHGEELVLFPSTLSGGGGLKAVGKHAKDEGDEFPFQEAGLHIDLENAGEGLLVEPPAISATEVTDLQHLHRSVPRTKVVAHVRDPKGLAGLLLTRNAGAGGSGSGVPALSCGLENGSENGVGFGKLSLNAFPAASACHKKRKKEARAEAHGPPAVVYEIWSCQRDILVSVF
jgi:hypothetical protein